MLFYASLNRVNFVAFIMMLIFLNVVVVLEVHSFVLLIK